MARRHQGLQRNWIGRSTGAEVDFISVQTKQHWRANRTRANVRSFREDLDDVLRVYTTRPDTLFGATYMVVVARTSVGRAAHDTGAQAEAVKAYREQAAAKERPGSHRPGQREDGRFHRRYAINPVNGEPIPIWIADYVLISYGTGAIMAVPRTTSATSSSPSSSAFQSSRSSTPGEY